MCIGNGLSMRPFALAMDKTREFLRSFHEKPIRIYRGELPRMPVPVLSNLEQIATPNESKSHELTVVSSSHKMSLNTSGIGHKRGLAHIVDVSIVYGFSTFLAKGIMMGFMALHLNGSVELSMDNQLFWSEAMQYGYQQIVIGSFTSLIMLYFIGMPYFFGRTFGLGLFGLRVCDAKGDEANLSALLSRFSMCLFSYMAFGIPFFMGLSRRDGQYFHDRISETFVTRI
ncbi:MAG: RDD family protein [Oligoflexia bacterium]|nr:RDD family protein [Oligoflexia bacterium]